MLESYSPQSKETESIPIESNVEGVLSDLSNEIKINSLESGKGFKKMVPKILRKFLYGFLSYVALSTSIEAGKRMVANIEYKKANDMLNEYKIENEASLYKETYDRAIEIFGKENISNWAVLPDDNESNIKNLDRSLGYDRERHTDIKEAFLFGTLSPIFAPEYLFKNVYTEEYKEDERFIQDRGKGSSFGRSDTTVLNEKDPNIILKNEGIDVSKSRQDTLKKQEFIEIINNTYPKNWFNKEVNKINITSDTTGGSSINQSSYGSNITGEAAHFEINNTRILLRDYELTDPVFAFKTISHEAGHANDWESNEDLKPMQRLNLLLKVADRLDDEDRFMSWYVENINPEDPKQKKYTKAVEYWAEICGEYFASGKENLSLKDVDLIEGVINLKDKNFNIDKALLERANIIQTKVYKKPVFDAEENAKLYSKLSAIDDKLDSLGNNQLNFKELNTIARKAGHYDVFDMVKKNKSEALKDPKLKEFIDFQSAFQKNEADYRALLKQIKKIPGREKTTDFDVSLDKTGVYRY